MTVAAKKGDWLMKIVAAAILALGLLAVPGVASAASWGAIAFSPSTRALGWTHDYSTQADAEDAAEAYCGKDADDCRVAISFRNACGAIAIGRNGGWGADWGVDPQTAQQRALNQCRRHDGGCIVKRWQCSGI
jgi:serine/threonine-protein kinase